MDYAAQLKFLRKSFAACRLQTLTFHIDGPIDTRIDLGMRRLIGSQRDYEVTIGKVLRRLAPNTLFHLQDQFGFCYQYLLLPDAPDTVLWVGPYFRREVTYEALMEAVEKYGFPELWIGQMAKFYSELPIVTADSAIHAMMATFCELIWGDSIDIREIDLNREVDGKFDFRSDISDLPTPEDVGRRMNVIQRRYAYENELMRTVSLGLMQKGSNMLRNINTLVFEQRNPDTLRNKKNYCIIMNTLLRKAAEDGGVHPIYLDSVSSTFALCIEQTDDVKKIPELMNDMFYTYCRLVNRRATKQYSLPVQRIIAYIDTDLTADLSLRALADSQNLSPGYLSTLFKKETGSTVTEYVNTCRVRHALRLFNSGHSQIQTVARQCGIPDANYFAKIFKKHVGKTPMEYRRTLNQEEF